ncbi:MAG: hypothetical protein ACW967_00700 [Candidatus Hodarchaeales archaeon]|jgi:hypothetical protein
MELIYNNTKYTIKKEFYKSKYFPILIIAFIAILILLFDQFTSGSIRNALLDREVNALEFISSLEDPSFLSYFFIIILILISIFAGIRTQKSQISPKPLSEIIEKAPFPMEIIEDSHIEVIRFVANELTFELSWYNTTGPYYKWKSKLTLKETHKDSNMVKRLADFLLMEEVNGDDDLSFYKIIVLRELPRHLIAIQYWYNLLQK